MWRGRSSRRLCAGALIALAALTACSSSDDASEEPTAAEPNGIEDLSPDEILAEVTSAVDDASSVKIVGSSLQGETAIEFDIQLGADGEATGSLTSDGQVIQIRVSDDTTHYSGDEAFWDAQAAGVSSQLAGKFVEVPADDTSFDQFADYDAFFETLLAAEGKVEVGDETTVDGAAALELIDTKDEGSLFVALEGEPLPLKVARSDGGELILSDWNADFTVEMPASDEIVDPTTVTPVAPSPSVSPSDTESP